MTQLVLSGLLSWSFVMNPAFVELVPATADHQSILSNLLQLYIHDFSELIPVELQVDGRFAYPEFPLYWSDPSHFPILAAVDGAWAGFAFVRQIHDAAGTPIWDMVEFFVLRGYRRRAIGSRVAHLAFARFHGMWQIRVMEANAAAVHFWRRSVETYTGVEAASSQTTVNNIAWRVFRFESRP